MLPSDRRCAPPARVGRRRGLVSDKGGVLAGLDGRTVLACTWSPGGLRTPPNDSRMLFSLGCAGRRDHGSDGGAGLRVRKRCLPDQALPTRGGQRSGDAAHQPHRTLVSYARAL